MLIRLFHCPGLFPGLCLSFLSILAQILNVAYARSSGRSSSGISMSYVRCAVIVLLAIIVKFAVAGLPVNGT